MLLRLSRFATFRSFSPTAFLLDGQTPVSGAPLRILYCHHRGAFLYYVKKLAYADRCTEAELGRVFAWRLDKIAREHGCDLSLLHGPSSWQVPGLFPNCFFIPQWISGQVRLDNESVYTGASPSRRRDIRKLDASDYGFFVSENHNDITFFYERMYLPTMDASHGLAAIKMNLDDALDRTARGEAELVMITDGQEPVAGSLVVYDAGRPRLLSMGVLHANASHYRQGIGSAIYLFSFRHLLERGFNSVDVGRTRPFLNDGTLYYKRRLGLELTTGSANGFYVKAHTGSPGVREFLCNNPFVYVDSRQLKGVAFSAEGIADHASLMQYNIGGLTDFRIVACDRDAPVSRRTT